MSIVLFLASLVFIALLFSYHKKNVKLKEDYSKLQEDFSRFRDEKEAFSIEMGKSNTELSTKTTDPLTGLPSRTAFEDRLRQAITQGNRYQISFAVMSMDLDEFGRIDQGSPAIRDELLGQVAERLLTAIREVDSVTRYAGSHFIFLLPQIIQPETAAYVASRVQESMLKPFVVNDEQCQLTACFGIAIYPLDGETVEVLLQKSSAALNEARRRGKNKYYFWHREIHALSERESQIFVNLRSQDLLQHLAVRYFPQVMAHSGRISGVYAMPSLLHPTLGEITGQELMKTAEHCGRATEIMSWAFRQAIPEAQRCHQPGEDPIILALSLTSRQIENAHFVFQMARIAKEIDFKVLQPIFEIIDSPSRMQSALIQQGFSTLTEAGIRFAIQMSAIGHNLLQKFPSTPFVYLKIDIRLVNTTIQQPEGESILSSMMTLTRNAGMDIVVEGVDEEGQKQYLTDLGFQKLQGKLFEYLLPEKKTVK